ncbi:MAG: helix-turn-helix domain-containing protein [Leucobacter sp.]
MSKTRVIELRQERGWTQERLADEAGVGLRTVQRLEAGHDASSTDWNVQRCSEAIGWTDANHATRIMKHIYGVTPTQYRQKAQARESF